MVVDRAGYRLNVGLVLINEFGRVFWGRRQGHDAWQFPQGGLATGETPLEAMFRELREEVGLERKDIDMLTTTKYLHNYESSQDGTVFKFKLLYIILTLYFDLI